MGTRIALMIGSVLVAALPLGAARATLIDGHYSIQLFAGAPLAGSGSFDVVGAAVQNLSYTFGAGATYTGPGNNLPGGTTMFSALLSMTAPEVVPTSLLSFASDGTWSCTSGIIFVLTNTDLCQTSGGSSPVLEFTNSGTYTLTRETGTVAASEPAALALLGISLAGLGWLRRRRAG